MKTSFQRCPLCFALPNDMNDKEKQENGTYRLAEGALTHGLNDLHFKLHCFDMLLNLSYKSVLPKEQRQNRGVENKKAVAARKVIIQDRFKEKLNLLIDIPKPSGGTTNSGNTTRRAFKDPKLLSEILEVDLELITKLRLIMALISSRRLIDHLKFKELCDATISIYNRLYGKFPMKPTVHKILFHGADIIKSSPVPVAYLSEEAAESKVKFIRYYRQHFSRKDTAAHTMQDIFNRSMDSSCPSVAAVMREKQKSKVDKNESEELEMYFVASNQEEEAQVDLGGSVQEAEIDDLLAQFIENDE